MTIRLLSWDDDDPTLHFDAQREIDVICKSSRIIQLLQTSTSRRTHLTVYYEEPQPAAGGKKKQAGTPPGS